MHGEVKGFVEERRRNIKGKKRRIGGEVVNGAMRESVHREREGRSPLVIRDLKCIWSVFISGRVPGLS